jgi:hypothetical protein
VCVWQTRGRRRRRRRPKGALFRAPPLAPHCLYADQIPLANNLTLLSILSDRDDHTASKEEAPAPSQHQIQSELDDADDMHALAARGCARVIGGTRVATPIRSVAGR